MLINQHKLIGRLALCFAISVLLHGVLLVSLNASRRGGSSGRGHDEHAVWNALTVRIDTSSPDKKLDTPAAKSVVSSNNTQTENPATSAAVPAAQNDNLMPGLSGIIPLQPSVPEMQYQTRMGYQQMQAMRAQQQAREQRQYTISHLQSDIEQRLNQRDAHAIGRCTWREGKAGTLSLRCEPKSLEQLFLPERGSLVALRDTLRMQGLFMEGFVVSSKEGRSVVDYLVRAAAKE